MKLLAPTTILLASLLVFVSPDAIADKLVILELRLTSVPPGLARNVRQRVREVLQKHGYSVLKQEGIKAKLRGAGAPPGCTMGPCLSRVGQVFDVDRVLVGAISGEGTSYDIMLTLLETGEGSPLAQVSDRCDVCNFMEAEHALARALKNLCEQARLFLSRRSRLTVQSTPNDAEVFLDGLPSGKTPVTRVLTPGTHRIEVARKGFSSREQQVQLEPGQISTLKISLLDQLVTRRDQSTAPSSTRRSRSWVRWTILGSGIVLGGIGGTLLALDGQEAPESSCASNTKVAGITLLGLGGAALISATLLTLLDGDSTPPKNR